MYFTLPLFEQANIVNREDLSGHRSSANPTVMIVEDDFSQALLLSEELKSKGFSILYHEDIERAMDDAQQVPLVGIVMDLKFGENLSGMDLVEFLRTNEKTKDIPIIISSALDKSMVDVEKYNVEKYFTKPYPPDELSTLLLTIIEEK